MNDDRPVLGIVLMVAFCALIPVGDALAKLLAEQITVLQILMARFGLQAVLLIPFCLNRLDKLPKGAAIWRAMFLRTTLHIAGLGFMVTALIYLPLADAVAIAFVMPFIMLLLGWWFLNEEVGSRRLIACGIGFCGTLMVVQPAFAEVGPMALLPLLVALVFSFFMLSTRQLSRKVDGLMLQMISGVMASVLLLAAWVLPILPAPARAMVPPVGDIGWMLLLTGIVGTASHYLMTLALRFAPSATLAPVQYLEIPFATLIGWIIWRDLPNGLAALGILITIGAGIYVILRERTVAQARAALAATPPPQ